MQEYKQAFIEFMLEAGVLRFGEFTTKSGRASPFFINTGNYKTGEHLARLASFYADAIVQRLPGGFDMLFGPAYKGIPLAVSVSIELHRRGISCGFCFNRKEPKDHGEGGLLIGQLPQATSRVLIVEDVTTAGTSIRETVPLLGAPGSLKLAGLVVSVDRMERGHSDLNALDELAAEFQMPTFAIVTIEEIMDYLRGRKINGQQVLTEAIYDKMLAYRERYGGKRATSAATA